MIEGSIPPALFRRPLDAIFLNSNRLRAGISQTLGDSPASVVVLANNDLGGCIPSSIGNMERTLNEIILLNNNLTGCIPHEAGKLRKVTVFDVSFNRLQGRIPASFDGLVSVEQLDIGRNLLTGFVPAVVCRLPRLENFTFSHNLFSGAAAECLPPGRGVTRDGRGNCIAGMPNQRPLSQCKPSATRGVNCSEAQCRAGKERSPPPPFPPPQKPNPRIYRRNPLAPPAPVGDTHRGFIGLKSPPPPAMKMSSPPPPFEHQPQVPPPQQLALPPPAPPAYCGSGSFTLPPVVGVSYLSPPPPNTTY